jgi:hypothetical protein
MTDRVVGAVLGDTTGRSRLTIINAATNPCTILNALQACSNAGVVWNWDGPRDGPIGAATNATYVAVGQNVELLFQTAAGTLLRLTLPAPSQGIMMADNLTVDPSNASIVTLVAACIGELSDGNGNTAATFLGGRMRPDKSDLDPIT